MSVAELRTGFFVVVVVFVFFFSLSPFTFSRASGNLLVFCLNSHWLLVIASLSLIGRCDVFCVGFIRTGFFVVVVVFVFFFSLSPFTFSRASGNLLVFCLNSHWLLVIASLSLIGRCDVFCVGFITR